MEAAAPWATMRDQRMRKKTWLASSFLAWTLAFPVGTAGQEVVRPLPYDLLYVRAPYYGPGPAAANSVWPDTVRPLVPDPGAQLVVLRRTGTREVLFPLERYRRSLDTPAARPLSVGSVSDPMYLLTDASCCSPGTTT